MTPPFPGDWRPAAPTRAQVTAHAGWWWRAWPHSPPVADRLSTGDDVDWRGPHVWSDEDVRRYDADDWDEGAGEWRRGALVCPCDASGAPVGWP